MKFLKQMVWSSVVLLGCGAITIGQQLPAEQPGVDTRLTTRPAVAALHGVVAAGHPIASSAGLQMLLKGGNAFDAAAAVGAMIALGEPQMNGIGGNGFVTLYDKKSGKVMSVAMTGATPQGLKPQEMTDETMGQGINAGLVPGNLGGYLSILERLGTMTLADVFAPAIEYAEKGYPIDPTLAADIARSAKNLGQYPTSAKIFLPGGQPIKAGELYRNPDYANTLRKLVEAEKQAKAKGATREAAIQAAFDRFYKGDIAQEFDRFFKEQGGVMRASDLATYEPKWAEPLHTTYHGYDVYTNPATSRGGYEVLMQANLVEGFDLKSFGPLSAKTLHAEIEAIKIAKSDVYKYVADPKFTIIPTAGMLSKPYATERRALIDLNRAGKFPQPGTPAGTAPVTAHASLGKQFGEKYEDGHTTSFSIADAMGNAIAITPTLGGGFGNNVVVGNTGLLLNNGIRMGSVSPYPTDVNYVGAGKIPLLNNSPIVVLKDGKLAFVFGTPGGETIGQTEFQVLVNLIDFDLPVQQAVEAPRFILDPDPNFYKAGATITVNIENRVPAATIAALKAMGHNVKVLNGWGSLGNVQAIRFDQKTGTMMAAGDVRRTAYAMGY